METKKRCTNFIRDEVKMPMNLVEEHKGVVECKKTDATSCSTKDAEWRKIEVKFNAVCGTGRTVKMIRSKWESLKKTVKKEYAEYKQCLYKTGGWPAVEVKFDAISSRVLAVIGIGAMGTFTPYDSDFVANDITTANSPQTATITSISELLPVTEVPNISTNIEIEEVVLCTTEGFGTSSVSGENEEIVQKPTWSSWNPLQLRQPISKLLQVPSSSATTDNDECPPGIAGTKIHTPTKLQTPKSVKRKRFYKAESTAEKLQNQRSGMVYEELAARKIEFIEFQMDLLQKESDRKEKRLAEKHKLEIEILQAELKNKQNC